MFAPAKLNLYLHITGRRDDGYHNLDSLVAFAGVGDEIRLEPSEDFHFTVEGPQAAALQKENADDNLVVKAARSLAVSISLRSNLVKCIAAAAATSATCSGLRAPTIAPVTAG